MECDRLAEIERLVCNRQRLVPIIARRFFPRASRDEDLLQCGLIGLWEAARQWRADSGFDTYARYCIMNNMRDYLRAEEHAASPVGEPLRKEIGISEEDDTIERLDLYSRIKDTWPENSRERYVLIALSRGVSRHAIAAALGVQLDTLQRIAKKAMTKLGTEKGFGR